MFTNQSEYQMNLSKRTIKPLLLTAGIFSFLFFYATTAFAQGVDLLSLARGEYLGMNALIDEKGKLFGYVSLYDYGKSGERTKKFEYVILDKNLNPVANNTFEGDITAGDFFGYLDDDGKLILKPSSIDSRYIKYRDIFAPASMEIDLASNTIRRKIFYKFDHGTFQEVTEQPSWKEQNRENRHERRENGFNYFADVTDLKGGDKLVLELDDYGKYEANDHIYRFDSSKKEIWRYSFNQNGSRSSYEQLSYLGIDENNYYGLIETKKADGKGTFALLVLDLKTGKEKVKKAIEGSYSVLSRIRKFNSNFVGSIFNHKDFDDKIVWVGRTVYQKFDVIKYNGIARMVIDKKSFEVEVRTVTYDDLSKLLPEVDSYGGVGKGYYLDPRDIFFLKNGSVGFLFEKLKISEDYTSLKTTDLVYVSTDSTFHFSAAKIFEKEKSKYFISDYLFKQYLNDGEDLVFFYRDYQRDTAGNRNWNLFINTYIRGELKQEMIPISSKKEYFIVPYLAKEGYILLREYNVKDKYNKARLERLNY